MECPQYQDHITRHIDRPLSPDVGEHLRGCSACRTYYEEEVRMLDLHCAALAPFRLREKISAKVLLRLPEAEEMDDLPTPGSRILWWGAGLSAAAAILMAIFTGFFSPNPDGKGVKESLQTGGEKPKEEEKKSPFVLVLDKEKDIKMTFVWINPGKFMMGSPENETGRDNNEKQHEVTLTKGYWMQTTEVTQGQWEAVMLARRSPEGEGGGNNPSHFKGDSNLPVEQVSWNDFQEFIKKVNEKYKEQIGSGTSTGSVQVDLPTEAEWEYACRAGATGRWCFGDGESRLGEYVWYADNSGNKTHPVGQKKPNAWGLYDMHGNVWEWCKDWYGEYPGSAVDPQGPSTGSARLVRGGSWYNNDRITRSANRFSNYPTNRYIYYGGRLVLRKSP